ARTDADIDRPDSATRSAAADDHAPGQVHAGGRLRDPACGADAPRAVYDDDVGGECRLRRDHRSAQPNGQREESARMARKNDGRKTAASGRKGAGAKSHAGRTGVGKRPAVASSKAAAPPA